MSFVYSPSHKIALPIHGLKSLSSRIQLFFPIDYRDGFQACHSMFLAKRPPQCSGSHISGVLRSTCQNPGKSYLLSRPCFYYEKNKMKVKLGKLEARKSVAPLCFILSSPPTGQSATIKYQIFFTKKEVHVCHVICYISLIFPLLR